MRIPDPRRPHFRLSSFCRIDRPGLPTEAERTEWPPACRLLDIFSGGKPEPNPQGEKEQREFKLNRGKALDTLLQDYP